jgi:hypothetical protein
MLKARVDEEGEGGRGKGFVFYPFPRRVEKALLQEV